MTHIKSFILLLALTFGIPWLLLVIVPHGYFMKLAPVTYSEAELETAEGNVFPVLGSGRIENGYLVYAAEGCAYCHTQMVRPTDLAVDMWHQGWGGRGPNWNGEEGAPTPLREPRPLDYATETYAFLGIQRQGPDLSNEGWSARDEDWHHRHLYNPRSVSRASNMPAFKHLYSLREIQGQISDKALQFEGENAAKAGYEIVPTERAEALVDYLMSLKKDYLMPVAIGGRPATATVAPEAEPKS